MAKYHVNPETNRPNICRAKTPESCKYYDKENQVPAVHYDSKEEARLFDEIFLSANNEPTVTLTKKDSVLETIDLFDQIFSSANDETTDTVEETTPEPEEEVFGAEAFTGSINTEDLPLFEAKIARRNARLEKAGADERFKINISEPYYVEVSKGLISTRVEKVDVTVNKPLIKAGDHTVIGCVDEEEGGLIYKNFGSKDDEFTPETMACDHCGQVRHRKRTFILKSNIDGKVTQIGSSCVGAYVGFTVPTMWVADDDLDDLYDNSNFTKHHLNYVPVDDLLNITLAYTDEGKNYVSRSSVEFTGGSSTAGRINHLLFSANQDDPDELPKGFHERLNKYRKNNKSAELIKLIEEADDNSEWIRNLKTIVKGENVSVKNMNLLISSVVILKQKAIEKQEAKKFTKGFAGDVGTKLPSQTVKVINKVTRNVYNPYSYKDEYINKDILTVQDQDGHLITFFASRVINVKVGADVVLKGATVKRHDQFKGNDQTIITRARFEED